MTDKERPEPGSEQQEPFLLTILPFAGLGLLLILAVVWRVVPGSAEAPSDEPATASPEELAATAIARFDQAPERDIPIDPERDFIIGPDDARITLVEFSDFECPYCRNAANGVHEVMQRFSDDVRLVFKHFPLDPSCNKGMDRPLHKLACRAAVMAWCAGQQDEGLFWDTHDALFREPQLTSETLNRIPGDLGLDADALATCMEAEASVTAIQNDIALGRRLGVTGTPVFFANGRKLSDYRQAGIEAVVEHMLPNE